MRPLLLTALLLGCSSPSLPPPHVGEWGSYRVEMRAMDGELGRAMPGDALVYIDPVVLDAPPVVRAWVLYHEHCHMLGIIDESLADRCAVRHMRTGGLLGSHDEAMLVLWVHRHVGAARAAQLLEAM